MKPTGQVIEYTVGVLAGDQTCCKERGSGLDERSLFRKSMLPVSWAGSIVRKCLERDVGGEPEGATCVGDGTLCGAGEMAVRATADIAS